MTNLVTEASPIAYSVCENSDTVNTKNASSDISLSEMSPKDAKFDKMKAASELLSEVLLGTDFDKWSERISSCADILKYYPHIDKETGEFLIKLIEVYFCHCRHCPVCDGRRSLRHMAMFRKSLPKILNDYPKARWVFMTLTVPNVPIDSLRDELKLMNLAWHRFVKRKEFKPVKGWIRKTEVTCEAKRKGYAHPHFHCLLMVSPSWFNTYYTRQSLWSEIWGECMKLDTTPIVDVRAVKGTPDKAAVEVLKAFNYSVKPETLVNNREWMLEYFNQVHYLKFIASGGALKNVFKSTEPETDESLIHVDGESEPSEDEAKVRVAFNWRTHDKQYRRFKKGDSGFAS
ncbi:protein rep [Arsenophonus nasoniae]|uniref:Protein rep n=1 Tax=Arsenophonus nasoniae TaxID=638 RepID=A0AA95GSP9_9GAMM|nr:protein rep [Arsenophonus nasoniae]WGM04107.1 protein rep [Arsenophonus nasoniae]